MTLKELLGDAYKEGMTAEEITKALENVSLPDDGTSEIERLKSALSKSNSEAADYKKQLRQRMTDDEVTKAEEQRQREELQTKYDELLKKVSVSENKAKLLAIGYSEALADKGAVAMAEGDLEKVLLYQKEHLDAVKRELMTESLKQTPKPIGDGNPSAMTLEKLKGMNVMERYQFSVDHPEEYKSLYEGDNK